MVEQKTNAMRILDSYSVEYAVEYYECKEFVNSLDIPEKIGAEKYEVFKSLFAQGKSERYYVFVLPGCMELDMKKAAKSVGEKSVALVPVKEINRLTGYVRGGCSPLGIKRQCGIVIHDSCVNLKTMYVSGGKIGCCISLAPSDLIRACNAIVADIVLNQT